MEQNSEKLNAIESQLRKALAKFNEFYELEPTEVHKVAVTQAFEFTFELSWKYLREILKDSEQEYFDSPSAIIKLGGKKNILTLNQVESWLLYLKSRNLTVHMYNQEVAEQIYQSLAEFSNSVNELINSIKRYINASS